MEFDYAKEPGRELLNSNRVSNDKPSVSIIRITTQGSILNRHLIA